MSLRGFRCCDGMENPTKTATRSTSSLAVLILEGLHEVAELLNTLHGHAIVERCTAAPHGTVPSKGVELLLLSPLEELLLQLLVAAHDGEGDVHPRACALLNGALVEAVRVACVAAF
eukprot:CAMPEP_0197943760 /NCGR_PEP_ID=MMETSP1439-20131203/125071_1 /TAXON_ID=66791 /ORGANISM="Gonyaulax spinifera, Strain CCMP409" /LENGTH=116 /DNA_ID=CAMNT_0043567015 /DNA_START=68 /DNA_END=418 /DNA_ORIENTATION=-